jgi:putative membrane protein
VTAADGPAPDPAPPGVQPERTALAWRRTALAVAVGSLAAGRLLEPVLGPGAWVLTLVGVPAAGGIAAAGARRARAWAGVLDGPGTRPGPGGGLLAGVTAAVVVLGGAALALVLA